MRRILLAGAAGQAAGRHHQRDLFAPAVSASPGLEVSGVWPGPPGAEGRDRAAELARLVGAPVVDDLDEALAPADAVVACVDVTGLDALVQAAPRIPVLVDKLAVLGTARLDALGADPRAATLVAAYHPRFHPGVVALAAAVASGELGLPHALHAELLVPYGDGPAADGDLRHVGVLALDAVAAVLGPPTGPATEPVTVFAVRTPTGDPPTDGWTLTIRWRPGVVVTLLVSRGRPGVPGSLHRYRVLGSDGQALVDLAAPALRLAGVDEPVAYGPSAVQLELDVVAAGGRGTTVVALAAISRLIDAAERSAADGSAHRTAD